MKRSQTLEEFAEDMRRKGDIRNTDLADEILMLVDLESDVAEPYSELCDAVGHYAPESIAGDPAKAAEWLGDRSNLLEEIEKLLVESDVLPKTGANGLPIHRDTDDAVKELLDTLAEAELILEAAGWPGDGDFLNGLRALADRPEPKDLTYDL